MKNRYTSAFVATRIFSILLLAAVSFSAQATKQIITVANFSFTPSFFSVTLGDTVEWDWVNGFHTTTSTTIPGGAAPWTQAMDNAPGDMIFMYVPTVTGTYNYDCAIHYTLMIASFDVLPCHPPTAGQAAISPGGPTTFCMGGSVTLSCATAGFTYQWLKTMVPIPGATDQSYNATIKGSYNCKSTNACGTTTSNGIMVTVNKLPKAKINPSGTVSFCVGQSAILSASTGANYTYQWYVGGNPISGETNSTLTVNTAGNYTVTVTISTTGCNKTSSIKKVKTPCRSGIEESGIVGIYPNPSSSDFTINFGSDASSFTDVQIFDVAGKLISSQKITGSTMVVGSDLLPGAYFARIISNGEVVQVLKMMKTE